MLLAPLAVASINVGVFAYRDAPLVEQEFAPLKAALNKAFSERDVHLKALDFDALDQQIAAGQLDFILTNPLHFLTIRQQHEVSGALATLSREVAGQRVNTLAGTIVTLAEHDDITRLADLEGKRIGTPGMRFLGGYLTQAYEIYQHGFRPNRFAHYVELESHDAVISALLAGDIDAGFVRSGTLERYDAERFHVVNAHQSPALPFAHSTRLYPEWAFAALSHVSAEEASLASHALLSQLGLHNGAVGFVPPLDYLQLEEAARALGVGPFYDTDIGLLTKLQRELGGWLWVMFVLGSGLVIALALLSGLYWQSRLQLAEIAAQRTALNHILWGTEAGTWEWNVQTGETRFNERWAEMVGYRLSELGPTTIDTWMSFCHPDDLKASEQALKAHFDGVLPSYDIEARMRHRDGHWIWVQDRGRVINRDEAGNPLWMAGTHTEITLRKQAEAEVSVVTGQLKKLALLLPGAIYQYCQRSDGHSFFPYSSPGIQALYGVTPEQAAQGVEEVFAVIHVDDQPAVAESIQHSAETLTLWQATYRVNHPDGRTLWLEGVAAPERLVDGSTMWHGYLRDITDAYTIQQERDSYRRSLEASNKELEHFAYAASHDLRQPLRMVTSYAQLLQRHLANTLDDDGRTMLHFMRDGAQRMDAMLLSLLEYSRVGRKGQPMQAVSLKQAVDEAMHFLSPGLQESDVTVRVADEWPTVQASPDEMTRLFQNLLSNAIKYRVADYSLTVDLNVALCPDGSAWRISVCDNGIGIPPDQQDRLFKVFQRLHTREQYDGTGVGLAICRKIVERHGGQIWVASQGDGQGSCFYFTLPTLKGDKE